MKIQWLNAERTQATITSGLFKKRVAHVIRSNPDSHSSYNIWTYVATGRSTNILTVETAYQRALDTEAKAKEWQDLTKLPQARIYGA